VGGDRHLKFSDRVFTFPTSTFFNWILCNRPIIFLFSDKINDYLISIRILIHFIYRTIYICYKQTSDFTNPLQITNLSTTDKINIDIYRKKSPSPFLTILSGKISITND